VSAESSRKPGSAVGGPCYKTKMRRASNATMCMALVSLEVKAAGGPGQPGRFTVSPLRIYDCQI